MKINLFGSIVVTTGVYNKVNSKNTLPWAICTPKYDLIDTDLDGKVDVIRYKKNGRTFELFPQEDSRLMVMANNLLREMVVSESDFMGKIEEYLECQNKIENTISSGIKIY